MDERDYPPCNNPIIGGVVEVVGQILTIKVIGLVQLD
jgi:hypothetical protein